MGAVAQVDDVAELNAAGGFVGNESVGERLEGYYVEAGYDVMNVLSSDSSLSLSPYVRWESLDTQAEVPTGFSSSSANDIDVLTLGLHFKPHDQIVFKLDFQDFDEGDDRLNFSFGYIF